MAKTVTFNNNAVQKYEKSAYDSAIEKGWTIIPQMLSGSITFTYSSNKPADISTFAITGTYASADLSQENKVIINGVDNITSVVYPSDTNIVGIDIKDAINLTSIKVNGNTFANGQITSLTSFNLSGDHKITDMSNMFNGCAALTTITGINTKGVTNMTSMFSGCSALTTAPIMDTSVVANISGIFKDCAKLTTIPTMNCAAVTDASTAFDGCVALTTVAGFNDITVSFNITDAVDLSAQSVNDILEHVGGVA